jgi:hypothetical protein
MKGKIGDSQLEARLDKMIWSEALENLSAYPENVDINPLIEGEFKKVASIYEKAYKKTVETKVNETIQSKKDNAAQQIVKGANVQAASNSEYDEHMSKGNLRGGVRSLLKSMKW